MLFHRLSLLAHTPGYLRFLSALKDPALAQKKQLQRILSNLEKQNLLPSASSSLESFPHDFPLTTYQDYHKLFESLRSRPSPQHNFECRWVATSGSTFKRKYFPYTPSFLDEFNAALSPWLFDLYGRYPRISSGRHYWSLSWVPPELRSEVQSDDSHVLSWFKQKITQSILINDPSLAYVDSSDEWLKKTCDLLYDSRDLSFISIWSPTFLFGILEEIERRYKINDFQELWPNLTLISCWDSGNSAYYALQLQERLPHVSIQGKGVWMTEAAVSIPFQNRNVPALTSHYFEFKCHQSQKIFPVWNLERGQRVEPIVSTSGGLLRYQTGDLLEVVDVDKNSVPNLRFLGRDKTTDLVGEKISEHSFSQMLDKLRAEFNREIVSFVFSHNSPQRAYELLVGPGESDLELCRRAEDLLMEHYHYKVARSLKQLVALKLRVEAQPLSYCLKLMQKAPTRVSGQVKIESIFVEELHESY